MSTHLVDGRGNGCALHKLLVVLDAEVGHANAACKPFLLDGFELLPHLREPARMVDRHVDEEEVNIIHLELLKALDERVAHGLALGHLPELRGDEERCARHAGRDDRVAERVFVLVELRAVEVHDAARERELDRVLGVLLVERGARAEADEGDLAAVVERDAVGGGHGG